MNIADLESSLFKFLYDNFEVPLGIKVFESVYYVDFETYDKWIVIDALSHTTGSLPKANYFLHISIKKGLLNETQVLNRLCDSVTKLLYPSAVFDGYNDATAEVIGRVEVSNTNLVPALQHAGGGSFRSLSVGLVYPGEVNVAP